MDSDHKEKKHGDMTDRAKQATAGLHKDIIGETDGDHQRKKETYDKQMLCEVR